MKILAVDYGDARTGIALCDPTETLASPVCVIRESYPPKLAQKILELVKKEQPEQIVLGLPVNMDGSEGFRAQKCREFAAVLETACGVPVALWDERMSTLSAYRMLDESNTHGKKRKEVVDAVAAMTILQSFLDHKKRENASF